MQPIVEENSAPAFIDRRKSGSQDAPNGVERRQFTNSYEAMQPEVQELAKAVDQYKMLHRRRFITYEELYDVVASLGYHK